jgi:diguanylate cyclase (GGDEF)-like protein
MKILVLNNDLTERSVIQQVLQRNGHQVVIAQNSEAAWEIVKQGGIRFVIADRTNTDMDEMRFIEKVRSAPLPAHIYLLLISAKGGDTETQSYPADDYLWKPLSTADLKTRVAIGERILTLGDNLKHAKGQLETLALLDPLTNLYNRKAFLKSAVGELERARRFQSPISMIMVSVDNFKDLNAQYGEEIGNDVLKLIAQIIREKSRPYDCIGRWDGEAFVTALPNVIGTDAEKVAQRVITSMNALNVTPNVGTSLKIQMSAGVAAVSHITAVLEVEFLIDQARLAMMRAREAGGNQVFVTYC